jgi:hypothetical protein
MTFNAVVYNGEFKTRMLAAGWIHLNDIYEFEAYRSSHRNEKLLVVGTTVPPTAPHIALVDGTESADVNSVSSKFTVCSNGLFVKPSALSVEFPAQYHINANSWFEQYALLGQIHKEAHAIAYESMLASVVSTEEQTYDSWLMANSIADM